MQAISQVVLGQADDLGGGVYKKRLGKNLYRSIVVAKGDRFWVYEFLFAKQDRANIDPDVLFEFRRIAQTFASMDLGQVDTLLARDLWKEICIESQTDL